MKSQTITLDTTANLFFGKRLFDIIFSFVILLILSPLFLLVALSIRFTSKGKVFYIQERLGKGGKVFRCYKFRTMHTNAETKLEQILSDDPFLKEEWEKKQKLSRDPRIFSLGKFLRKSSLDELPQFFNVLKGDLSVVGPRPYMLSQIEDLGNFSHYILLVRPGITGIWQTSGRSSTTFQERISLDMKYLEKQSFWFDIFLILKTIPSVIFPKNAC